MILDNVMYQSEMIEQFLYELVRRARAEQDAWYKRERMACLLWEMVGEARAEHSR